jgi:hypothetical protein
MTSKGLRLELTINRCIGNLTSHVSYESTKQARLSHPNDRLSFQEECLFDWLLGNRSPSSIVNERALASEVERAVSEEVFPTMVFDLTTSHLAFVALFAMMVTLVVVAVIGISSM